MLRREALAGMAFCLVSASFVAGWFWAGTNAREEQRYPKYQIDVVSPQEKQPLTTTKRPPLVSKYREPCDKMNGREDSDLCAQWHAASAAEKGAFWSRWSAYLTALGVIGLIVTLYQAQRALNKATEANIISQNSAEFQGRAYFTLNHAEYCLPKNSNSKATFTIRLLNNGITPAEEFRHFYYAYVDGPRKEIRPVNEEIFESIPLSQIGPGQAIPIWNRKFELSNSDREEIISGSKWLYVSALLKFRTIYGKKYRVSFGRHTKLDPTESMKVAENGDRILFTSSGGWHEREIKQRPLAR